MGKLKHLWLILALVPIYTLANNYKINKFTESYDNSVNVSGSILSSLLVSGALKLSSPDDLYVYITPEQRQINLSLVSIDGRYNADVSIEVAVVASSWIKLSLPSTEQEKFKKYKFNELVALAYADGKDKRGRYVQEVFPISWGEPDNSLTQFYINSAGFAPNYTFNDVEGNTKTVECEEISDPSARAFNHVCAFSRKLIGEKAVITFSPDMESSGKKYVIWTSP